MAERPWGNEYRTTVVCIDSYENGVPAGRFYNPYLKEGIAFQSLVGFLSAMEDTLDKMTFPQSFSAVRSFSALSEAPPGTGETEAQEGKVMTFALRVLFRQNATWQGSITCVEKRCDESFRSALELIFLMDSALRDKQ